MALAPAAAAPTGTYTVTCSAPGHSTQTITGVQITTGGLATVNCQT